MDNSFFFFGGGEGEKEKGFWQRLYFNLNIKEFVHGGEEEGVLAW